MAFKVSSLQGELRTPTIGSLLRANAVIEQCHGTADVALTFGEVDFEHGGVVGISAVEVGAKEHSQAAYLLFFADPAVLNGGVGRIALWDWRSHRLKRVGNSSYVVETYSLDEMVDAAQLIC